MALPENPENRLEQYLQNIAEGSGDIPETPANRLEQYLAYIAGNMPEPVPESTLSYATFAEWACPEGVEFEEGVFWPVSDEDNELFDERKISVVRLDADGWVATLIMRGGYFYPTVETWDTYLKITTYSWIFDSTHNRYYIQRGSTYRCPITEEE